MPTFNEQEIRYIIRVNLGFVIASLISLLPLTVLAYPPLTRLFTGGYAVTDGLARGVMGTSLTLALVVISLYIAVFIPRYGFRKLRRMGERAGLANGEAIGYFGHGVVIDPDSDKFVICPGGGEAVTIKASGLQAVNYYAITSRSLIILTSKAAGTTYQLMIPDEVAARRITQAIETHMWSHNGGFAVRRREHTEATSEESYMRTPEAVMEV